MILTTKRWMDGVQHHDVSTISNKEDIATLLAAASTAAIPGHFCSSLGQALAQEAIIFVKVTNAFDKLSGFNKTAHKAASADLRTPGCLGAFNAKYATMLAACTTVAHPLTQPVGARVVRDLNAGIMKKVHARRVLRMKKAQKGAISRLAKAQAEAKANGDEEDSAFALVPDALSEF